MGSRRGRSVTASPTALSRRSLSVGNYFAGAARRVAHRVGASVLEAAWFAVIIEL